MELPKRKAIRLTEYDYSTPGAYFITICTKDRACILSAITADAFHGDPPSSVGAAAPGGPLSNVGAAAPGGPYLQLTDIGKVAEQYILSADRMTGFHVDKYVVMPNHIHMILRIDSEPALPDSGPPRAAAPTVSDAIGALKRLVNRRSGHDIWQRSFYEHVIRNERDYREIWEYIDANPAKWAEDRYFMP